MSLQVVLKSLCIGNFSKALGLHSEMKKPISSKVHAYKTLRKKYSVVAHLQNIEKKIFSWSKRQKVGRI